MPSTHNITGTAQWTTPIAVPDDGARITADAAGGSDGPVNPAFQDLMDRDKALAQNVVTFKAIQVDGVGEQPSTAGAGDIDASGDIHADGNITADQAITATLDVTGRTCQAVLNGDAEMSGARVQFTTVGTGASEGNPPRTTALTNEIRPLNICKAWARFEGDGNNPSAFTYTDGCNFLTAVPQTTRIVRFGFSQPMADANFCAVCSVIDTSGAPAPRIGVPQNWNASYVDILFDFDIDGASALPCDGSLVVFGRQ